MEQLPDLVLRYLAPKHYKLDGLSTVSLMAEEEGGFQVFVLHDFVPDARRFLDQRRSVYLSVYNSNTHSWTTKVSTSPRLQRLPQLHLTCPSETAVSFNAIHVSFGPA